MASADELPPPKSPALLIVATIAMFVAIIGGSAAYFLWPRGDRLGAIDLRADAPSLTVTAGAGDKLTFRIDTIVVGTVSGYPDSSRSRTNRVHEELAASRIRVSAVASDGASKTSTECAAFAGASASGSSDTDSVTSSGIPVDCSLVVENAGTYTLTAAVAWAPKDVRKAILEVRRQKAGR